MAYNQRGRGGNGRGRGRGEFNSWEHRSQAQNARHIENLRSALSLKSSEVSRLNTEKMTLRQELNDEQRSNERARHFLTKEMDAQRIKHEAEMRRQLATNATLGNKLRESEKNVRSLTETIEVLVTEKVEAEQELKKTKAMMQGKEIKEALQQQMNEMDKAMQRMQLDYAAWREQVDEATKTSESTKSKTDRHDMQVDEQYKDSLTIGMPQVSDDTYSSVLLTGKKRPPPSTGPSTGQSEEDPKFGQAHKPGGRQDQGRRSKSSTAVVRTLMLATPQQATRRMTAERKRAEESKAEAETNTSDDFTSEVSNNVEKEYQELLRGVSGIERGDKEMAGGTGGDGNDTAVQGKVTTAIIAGAAAALGIKAEKLQLKVGGGTGFTQMTAKNMLKVIAQHIVEENKTADSVIVDMRQRLKTMQEHKKKGKADAKRGARNKSE